MGRRSTSGSSPQQPGELIAVGVIRKAHGVRGESSVEPLTDTVERFEELERVFLVSPDRKQTVETTVESARFHAGRALVKFAAIPSPEAVRDFYDWTVEIPEEEARPLEKDEYFLHDLEGLQVVDGDGRLIGIIVKVIEGGGGFLLEVKKSGGGSFDLPFAADICTEIDIEAKKIVVNLPPGLESLDEAEES